MPKSYRSHDSIFRRYPVEFLGSYRAVQYSGRPVQYSATPHTCGCVVTFAFGFFWQRFYEGPYSTVLLQNVLPQNVQPQNVLPQNALAYKTSQQSVG
jgi:hypothetical protein